MAVSAKLQIKNTKDGHMANIKKTLETAKKKLSGTSIKKAAIIGGAAIASLAPLKSGAQSLNKDDIEKQKWEVVLDTLRMGIEVKNVSSKDKPFNLTVLTPNDYYTFLNRGYHDQPDGVDKKGGYNLVDSRIIKKVNENSYEYNTDLVRDRYLSIINKVFKVNEKLSMIVTVADKYSMIRMKEYLNGNTHYCVIVNDKEEFIYATILIDGWSTFGKGKAEGAVSLHIIAKDHSEQVFPLKSDGSGFEKNPPSNLIKSPQTPSIDNSNSR